MANDTFALVMGGGNALGAYHGGVAEAMEAEGVWPDRVAGSSIGAVMGALIAGNPPERRVPAIREFWRRVTQPDGPASLVPDALRLPAHLAAVLGARLTGQPGMFTPRYTDLFGTGGNPSFYDLGPMRRSLTELVDFDLLNSGAVRFQLMAVDVETGQEVPFDTARERIEPDHVVASAGLIPDFAPVEIGGRALVDGGLADNVPSDLVLLEEPGGPVALFAVDLYPSAAPRPRTVAMATQRIVDLIYRSQTDRTLRAMRAIWELRAGPHPGAVYRLEYPDTPGEVSLKSYDFSASSLQRRWAQGERDMRAALRLWREQPPSGRGLYLHPPIGPASTEQRSV